MTAGANILKVFRITPDVDPNTTEKFSGKFSGSNLVAFDRIEPESICVFFLIGQTCDRQKCAWNAFQRMNYSAM